MNETTSTDNGKDTEKREIIYIEPVVPFNEASDVITYIGSSPSDDTKYGIVWSVPVTDEEAKDRYDCSLNDLIRAGVRQFTTRPNYKTVGFDENGTLVDGGHEAMQQLADSYKCGTRRGPSKSDKKLAAELKSAGIADVAALKAKLEKMKELGLLDD